MVTVARAAGHVAGAGSRTGWLASIKHEALSFVKGDNNAPWAILAETVIGCVPVLGQLVDARDIIKGLVEVAAAPASPLAWFNLITALIGLVPGGGDAAKRSMRAIKSGAVRPDELLDMIRRLYKGDPEKVLKDVLDLSKLRKLLNDVLDNPRLLRQLSPELRRRVDEIQRQLNAQFDAFKREIDGWLARGRKTSAAGGPGKPGVGAPARKPSTRADAGSRKPGQGDSASANTPNTATQKTQRFKSLTNKVLGVLGEHMADYHCQDAKGWGAPMRHDDNGVNAAKLNDSGHLVQLWPCIARGRGIDAVWKTNGARPYAVVEAKASYDPTKGLAALLGEAGDKTESGGGAAAPAGARAGRSGRSGSKGGGPGATGATRQANGKVMQMSKTWVEPRLSKAVRDKVLGETISLKGYSRHVVFFSIPQAMSHSDALIRLGAQQKVGHGSHAEHKLTREWREADIDRVATARSKSR
jgi:hypothetical protein